MSAETSTPTGAFATLDRLVATLEWMESCLDVSWPTEGEVLPDPPHLGCLNGRVNLALALEDHEMHEEAHRWLVEIEDANVCCDDADPKTRLALAWAKKEYAHALARRAMGKAPPQPDLETRLDLAAQVYDIVVPYFDELSQALPGEKGALELWGKGYSVAAWAQRGHHRDKARRLLARVVEVAKKHPEIGSIREAMVWCVTTLLETQPQAEDEGTTAARPGEERLESPAGLWREVQEIFDTSVKVEGEPAWLVGAVGVSSQLAHHLDDSDAVEALEFTLDLEKRWNDACCKDNNAPWAVWQLLVQLFSLTKRLRREQLDVPHEAFLLKLSGQSLGRSRRELAHFLYTNPSHYQLIRPEARRKIFSRLLKALGEISPKEEHESLEIFLGAIHALADEIGEEAVAEAWVGATGSPPRGREIWLQLFVAKAPRARSEDHLRSHLDGAFAFREEVGITLGEFARRSWTEALLALLAAAQCLDDISLLDDACDRLATGPGSRLDWLQAVTIAATGLGRTAPELVERWSEEALSIDEPALRNENGLEIFSQALATLTNELAKISPERAAKLVDRLEGEIDRIGERKLTQMSKEFLRDLNARLATSLYNQWALDDSVKDVDSTLGLFDKLWSIESRAERSALAQLHFMAPQLAATLPEDHPHREEIERRLGELESKLATVQRTAPQTPIPSLLRQRDASAEAEVSEEQHAAFYTGDDIEWAFDPICPGEWLPAAKDHEALLRALVVEGLVDEVESVEGCRLVHPSFYPGVALAEVQVLVGGEARMATFALSEELIGRIDGTSPWIHKLNAALPIALHEENVLEYLEFFCLAVLGEEGPFRIASRLKDIPGHGDLAEAARETVTEICHPPEILETKNDGTWIVSAVVKYSNALFKATFSIAPKGMIEMLDDDPVAADIPFVVEGFDQRLRFQKTPAAAE